MKKLLLSVALTGFLFSCGEEKTVPSSKNDCIESSLNVKHLGDSLDVLETTHVVYGPGGKKVVVHSDTLPSLGKTTQTADDGSSVTIDKDYDLFITVK
jgi:hypothetical protein